MFRHDINQLRALSVFSVIAFHSNIPFLDGGYLGVDVFFVVSGFLITQQLLAYRTNSLKNFVDFYFRRFVRIIPSLLLTLWLVLTLCFFVSDAQSYRSLGKEIFFSVFGALNIFYAQGQNYFEIGILKPLSHLWSLGVEEQFYVLVAPLIFFLRKNRAVLVSIFVFIFGLSLFASQQAVTQEHKGAYYLLQFRAFELIIGCFIGFFSTKLTWPISTAVAFRTVGYCILLASVMLFDSLTPFPGIYALCPLIGVVLILIAGDSQYKIHWLSRVGLASYPLYLIHQPILYAIGTTVSATSFVLYILTLAIGLPLSFCITTFVENPCREIVKSSNIIRKLVLAFSLFFLILCTAVASYSIVKTGGLPWRYKIFNPFGLEIIESHSDTFFSDFQRGFNVSDAGEILFLGDSMVQQYVVPTINVLGIDESKVDTVTRGGCVLLKGIQFADKFSDISCNSLRERLYSLEKKWNVVVISQDWQSYKSSVQNFKSTDESARWTEFVDNTIQHFQRNGAKVIIFGDHITVSGTRLLQPSLSVDRDNYKRKLKYLEGVPHHAMAEYFEQFKDANTTVISSAAVFCADECKTHDGKWSFFKDEKHITDASTNFVTQRLSSLIPDLNFLFQN